MSIKLYQAFQHWSEKGTVWIYSDPHFADPDAQFFAENRPSDDEIVKRINNKVGKNDTIIILGDIGDIEYLKQIRGYKVLILGNHDVGASKYKRIKTEKEFTPLTVLDAGFIQKLEDEYPGCKITFKHVNSETSNSKFIAYIDNHLCDEVYEGPVIIHEKIILSHEPITLPYMYNIHGHIHNIAYKGDTHHLNCVAEVLDYTPVNLNRIIKSGALSNIDSIHRETIDRATANKISKAAKNGECCSCYHPVEIKYTQGYGDVIEYIVRKEEYGECYGTPERDKVYCKGNKSNNKCVYYREFLDK